MERGLFVFRKEIGDFLCQILKPLTRHANSATSRRLLIRTGNIQNENRKSCVVLNFNNLNFRRSSGYKSTRHFDTSTRRILSHQFPSFPSPL